MAVGKNLGSLVGQIGADIRQWEKASGKIKRDLKDIQRTGAASMKSLAHSLDQAGKKMQQMGRTMTMRVTAPLVALGGLAVREFGNFDAAMTQSLAIMGNVSSAMRNDMADAARLVARTTSFSAQQAAESYFFLASAGLDAAQSLAALPQVAKFAQAGMFDMATATDLATDAQSALGLTVKDTQQNLRNMARVTDVLVKANTLANATVEQFSTALTREAGAALKSFNIDIEEGVAVLAAFADQGIKGERAGSGLGRILRLLTQAANDNAEEMDQLGISVFDARGNIRNLADIVGDLETALEGMSDQQRTASLDAIGFTARVQQMILPLLGTSDAIRRYEAELRNAAGTTDEVSRKQLQTFNEQLGLLWSNLRDVAIQFGQTMAPALQKMVKWSSGVVDAFREMEDQMRIRIIAIAGLFAVGGPLLMALGVAARVIAGFISIIFSKFTLITGILVGTIGTAQWFVDNWELLFERAKKAIIDFFSIQIPEIRFSGLIGDEVQKASEALSDIFGSQESRNRKAVFEDLMKGAGDAMAILNGNLEIVTGKVDKSQRGFTTWGESFRNALGMMGDSMSHLLGFDDLLSNFEALFEGGSTEIQTSASTQMHGFDEGIEKAEISTQKLSEAVSLFVEGAGSIRNVYLPALEEAIAAQNRQAQASQFAMGIANDFTASFGQGMTNVVVQGKKLMDVLKNIGRLLASAVIQRALSVFLTGGLGGAGFFGAAGGLFGSIFGVNDALITSDGKVIEFNPRDNILAFQGAIPSAGGQVIENHLYIDGREIEISQEERQYRKR